MATRRRVAPSMALQSAARTGTANVQRPDPDQLVQEVLGTTISLDIPADASLNSVEATLVMCIDAHKRLSDAAEKLKPIIGRILLVISNRKLWRKAAKPYKNFTEYLEDIVVESMGFGRTTAFEALRIARAFPSLSVDDYQRFGAKRLLAASSITDENDPRHKEVLESSLGVPVSAFEASVKDARELASTSTTPSDTAVFSVRLPVPVKNQWDELLRNSHMSGPELFAACIACYIEHGNAAQKETAAKPEAKPEAAKDAIGALNAALAHVTR